MELDHDESARGATSRTIRSPLALTLVAAAATVGLYGLDGHPLALAFGVAAFAAAWLAQGYFLRRVVVTHRRIVEYRPDLARWARSLPRLAGLELRRRRVIELDLVAQVERRGTAVRLHMRDGAEHRVECHDLDHTAEVFGALEARLGERRVRGPRTAFGALGGRPAAVRVGPVQVTARPAPEARRCPYCHDGLDEDDVTPCPGCAAPHHAECLEIHGGCSAYGCQRPLRRQENRLPAG